MGANKSRDDLVTSLPSRPRRFLCLDVHLHVTPSWLGPTSRGTRPISAGERAGRGRIELWSASRIICWKAPPPHLPPVHPARGRRFWQRRGRRRRLAADHDVRLARKLPGPAVAASPWTAGSRAGWAAAPGRRRLERASSPPDLERGHAARTTSSGASRFTFRSQRARISYQSCRTTAPPWERSTSSASRVSASALPSALVQLVATTSRNLSMVPSTSSWASLSCLAAASVRPRSLTPPRRRTSPWARRLVVVAGQSPADSSSSRDDAAAARPRLATAASVVLLKHRPRLARLRRPVARRSIDEERRRGERSAAVRTTSCGRGGVGVPVRIRVRDDAPHRRGVLGRHRLGERGGRRPWTRSTQAQPCAAKPTPVLRQVREEEAPRPRGRRGLLARRGAAPPATAACTPTTTPRAEPRPASRRSAAPPPTSHDVGLGKLAPTAGASERRVAPRGRRDLGRARVRRRRVLVRARGAASSRAVAAAAPARARNAAPPRDAASSRAIAAASSDARDAASSRPRVATSRAPWPRARAPRAAALCAGAFSRRRAVSRAAANRLAPSRAASRAARAAFCWASRAEICAGPALRTAWPATRPPRGTCAATAPRSRRRAWPWPRPSP